MTTGRINQVATLRRERSRRTRISIRERARKGAGPELRRDPVQTREETRVLAFQSGSTLTTSPTASTPKGLRTWASRVNFASDARAEEPNIQTKRIRTTLQRHWVRAAGGNAETAFEGVEREDERKSATSRQSKTCFSLIGMRERDSRLVFSDTSSSTYKLKQTKHVITHAKRIRRTRWYYTDDMSPRVHDFTLTLYALSTCRWPHGRKFITIPSSRVKGLFFFGFREIWKFWRPS